VSDSSNSILLSVENLKTYFYMLDGVARAVDGVSFRIKKGQTLGMVGESGCGKSVTALSILRLLPSPPGRIVEGKIHFTVADSGKNVDLLRLTEREMRAIRGAQISMVFQEPMTSLNPVFTVGEQVAEVLRIHRRMNRREARRETLRMLELVKIPEAAKRMREYPHQMSGGMRQRVMIAMALACNPRLLIADEPSTALDVTVQAQILELMEELKSTFDSSILLITHDLGVVAEVADEVVVMYAGMIVEQGDVWSIFDHPAHPYTVGLMRTIPKLEDIRNRAPLLPIEGTVPDPLHYPEGCRFHPRCPLMTEECRRAIPELSHPAAPACGTGKPGAAQPGHLVRCIHSDQVEKLKTLSAARA
jgi:oligopeptide/dipeptide ABC transporter ATP-binding protein